MTLIQLRTLIRLTLASVADWPDTALDQWIGQAIHLYSAHFPRRQCGVIDLTAGVQAYPLPGGPGVVRILTVIHPAGAPDAQLLTPVAAGGGPHRGGPHEGGSLGAGAAVYALRPLTNPDAGVAEIVLGPTVRTGEQAAIDYLGPHPVPATDDAELTVPPQHLAALTAYVEFAAHYALECAEAPNLDAVTIVLAQLGDAARKAWVRYKEVMDRLVWLAGPDLYTPAYIAWGPIGL